MGRRSDDASGSKPDLLDLWIGEGGTPPSPGPRRVPWALLIIASAIGALMLASYPRDVLRFLPIVLGLLVAGLALRVLGKRAAESTFLSAPWLIIAAFGAALAAYAFFAPDIDFASLSRYLPRPVVNLFR